MVYSTCSMNPIENEAVVSEVTVLPVLIFHFFFLVVVLKIALFYPCMVFNVHYAFQ